MIAPWPRSLVGRTILVLCLAVLVSNGLGLAAYFAEQRSLQASERDRAIAERVVAAARLLDETAAPADRRRQIWSLRGAGLRMLWAREPLLADDPLQGRLRSVHEAFVEELATDPGDGLRLSLGGHPFAEAAPPGPGPMAADGGRFSPQALHRPWRRMMAGDVPPDDRLHGALRLGDGSWLLFAASLAPAQPAWTVTMLLLIAAASLAAAAIAAFAVWRASAPLSMFATAAERLGRDLDAEPLAATGPQEVARAARAFNGMQARLQEVMRQRMQMLAALSHDLRTPMTRLRLRAELLDDREQQEKILSDLDQIEALTTASLDYVRDALRDERPVSLDLAVLAQTVCDEAEDAGGIARYAGPEHVPFVARPVALRRALTNLIDNAIKYGEEATVSLAVDPSAASSGVSIAIEDRGPGLPEDERERVFEPFYRLDRSRSRETGGLGLGLAIVRAVAVAHGGTVTLANRASGGLRVTLSLPGADFPRQAEPGS